MATLEATPGGSAVDLGYVQVSRMKKTSGITLIPEILGDSDEVEALKLMSSTKSWEITGVLVGTSSAINTFKTQLETWAVNGDGTTSTTVDPTPIDFVDDDGVTHTGLVLDIDYTRLAGKVSVIDYTIKMGQAKVL